MDLSKYEASGGSLPEDLPARYRELHAQLEILCAAPVKNMPAIDALIVELDEVQAAMKHFHKGESDPQRF
jgi:hypothetical protein